jgi:hypothetical protein
LVLPAARTDLLPLAAIVVPQPDRAHREVGVRRLAGAEALLTLSRFPRIVGWQETGVLEQQFRFLGQIVQLTPVFVATVPWGPPFAGDLAATILALTRP